MIPSLITVPPTADTPIPGYARDYESLGESYIAKQDSRHKTIFFAREIRVPLAYHDHKLPHWDCNVFAEDQHGRCWSTSYPCVIDNFGDLVEVQQ